MDRLVVLLGVVLALAGATGWVGAQNATPGAGATPCPSAAASPVASPGAVALASPPGSPVASPVAAGCGVGIADFAFEPARIEVAVGTKVTWSNRDSSPHTVPGDDGGFDCGRLDPDPNFARTFDGPAGYD